MLGKKDKIKGYSITRSMENKKQLPDVSPNTRNKGHKMKLVGGRLNIKRNKEAEPQPTHSRAVPVTATGCWGRQNFLRSDMLMEKEKAAGENGQKTPLCTSINPGTAWKIFSEKDHWNLSLLSHISSRHGWGPWAG